MHQSAPPAIFDGFPLPELDNPDLEEEFIEVTNEIINHIIPITSVPKNIDIRRPPIYLSSAPEKLINISPNYQSNRSNFTNVAKIGSGSFGEVFSAENKVTNDTVVVKVLPKDRIRRQAIENEARILKHLKSQCSPFILYYLDFFEDYNDYYLVTEFLSGYITLENFILNSESINPFSFPSLANRLISGLIQIHRLNVVHNDIKPENIMINPKNLNIKYIDFGLSCYASECESFNIAGTPHYIAPELLFKRTQPFTFALRKQSDIWSLGLTLVFMLLKDIYYDAFIKNYVIPGWYSFDAKIAYEIEKSAQYYDFISRITLNNILSSPDPLILQPLLAPPYRSFYPFLSKMLTKNPYQRSLVVF